MTSLAFHTLRVLYVAAKGKCLVSTGISETLLSGDWTCLKIWKMFYHASCEHRLCSICVQLFCAIRDNCWHFECIHVQFYLKIKCLDNLVNLVCCQVRLCCSNVAILDISNCLWCCNIVELMFYARTIRTMVVTNRNYLSSPIISMYFFNHRVSAHMSSISVAGGKRLQFASVCLQRQDCHCTVVKLAHEVYVFHTSWIGWTLDLSLF